MQDSTAQDVVKLSPSSFPYLHRCPCWERLPVPPNEAMKRGTAMDSLFREYLGSGRTTIDGIANNKLTSAELKGVEWAGNSVRRTCGSSNIISDKKGCKFRFTIGGALISGEMDSYCPDKTLVFDLKSGAVRDYDAQMIPYSHYAMMDTNRTTALTCLVFCDKKMLRMKPFEMSYTEDWLNELVDNVTNPNKKPMDGDMFACTYCKFGGPDKKCKLKK